MAICMVHPPQHDTKTLPPDCAEIAPLRTFFTKRLEEYKGCLQGYPANSVDQQFSKAVEIPRNTLDLKLETPRPSL